MLAGLSCVQGEPHMFWQAVEVKFTQRTIKIELLQEVQLRRAVF